MGVLAWVGWETQDFASLLGSFILSRKESYLLNVNAFLSIILRTVVSRLTIPRSMKMRRQASAFALLSSFSVFSVSQAVSVTVTPAVCAVTGLPHITDMNNIVSIVFISVMIYVNVMKGGCGGNTGKPGFTDIDVTEAHPILCKYINK